MAPQIVQERVYYRYTPPPVYIALTFPLLDSISSDDQYYRLGYEALELLNTMVHSSIICQTIWDTIESIEGRDMCLIPCIFCPKTEFYKRGHKREKSDHQPAS